MVLLESLSREEEEECVFCSFTRGEEKGQRFDEANHKLASALVLYFFRNFFLPSSRSRSSSSSSLKILFVWEFSATEAVNHTREINGGEKGQKNEQSLQDSVCGGVSGGVRAPRLAKSSLLAGKSLRLF
jgi:hypothetical protein